MLGAKVIVFRGGGAELHSLAWATYQLGHPNDIHHRDAVAAILFRRQRNLADAAVRASHAGFRAFATAEADRLGEIARRIMGIDCVRRLESYPTAIVEEMQGFQLATSLNRGVRQVVKFELESSVTKAQVMRASDPFFNYRVNVETLAKMIMAVHYAIEPGLRGYRVLEIDPQLYNLLFQRHEIEHLKQLLRLADFKVNGRQVALAPLVRRGT